MINDINHSRVINQTCVHSIGQGGGREGKGRVVKEGEERVKGKIIRKGDRLRGRRGAWVGEGKGHKVKNEIGHFKGREGG